MRIAKMHLEADTIDRHTAPPKITHHGIDGIRLRIHRLRLHVVVKEQRARISRVSPAEAVFPVSATLARVSNARLVIPDRAAQFHRSSFVERLVDDVPGGNFVTVVSNDRLDVLFKNPSQLLWSSLL